MLVFLSKLPDAKLVEKLFRISLLCSTYLRILESSNILGRS